MSNLDVELLAVGADGAAPSPTYCGADPPLARDFWACGDDGCRAWEAALAFVAMCHVHDPLAVPRIAGHLACRAGIPAPGPLGALLAASWLRLQLPETVSSLRKITDS